MPRSAMYQRFFEELQHHVPNLFSGRILYVGANRHASPTYVADLREAGCEIHLLEAYGENVEHYENVAPDVFDSVSEGDVRNLTEYETVPWAFKCDAGGLPNFDAILWWHGPEHVTADEWPTVLANLEALAPLVVVGCPWGAWGQEPIGGNPYETHQSAIYPVQLKDLGYEVMLVGKPNLAGFITAWKGETGGPPRASWYYAKLATSHTFWLVSGDTRRALRAKELYSYGLYPVRVVSEDELEAIPIEGDLPIEKEGSGTTDQASPQDSEEVGDSAGATLVE